MSSDYSVVSTTDRGFTVLSVSFSPNNLLMDGFSDRLTRDLVESYVETRAGLDKADCLVVMEAEVAGSAVVRSLFELYKLTQANRGRLICVGFPETYVSSLAALGVLDLPGFELGANRDEALSELESSTRA